MPGVARYGVEGRTGIPGPELRLEKVSGHAVKRSHRDRSSVRTIRRFSNEYRHYRAVCASEKADAFRWTTIKSSLPENP